MHVEHIMTRDPVACDARQPATEVARLMRDKGVGAVVVLRDGKVAGIVTDRQITTHVVAAGADPNTFAIEDAMTPNPARLTLDDTLFSAIDTLRSAGVARRAPVVNAANELLGVVSVSDIAVVAKDCLDAVLLEETHHALEETHLRTGGKRLRDALRNPRREVRREETRPVTAPTPSGDGEPVARSHAM